MTLQSGSVAMALLSVDNDPTLQAGVHLRWRFRPALGFRGFGVDVFRRLHRAGTPRALDLTVLALGEPSRQGDHRADDMACARLQWAVPGRPGRKPTNGRKRRSLLEFSRRVSSARARRRFDGLGWISCIASGRSWRTGDWQNCEKGLIGRRAWRQREPLV
jgi:hypothetical protein